MFAYCGNNPVTRIDPTGCWFEYIWDFLCSLVSETSSAMASSSSSYAALMGASAFDGPLPFVDTLAFTGVLFLGAYNIIQGTSRAIQGQSNSVAKAEEKAEVIAVPEKTKKKAIFPVNPYAFAPSGLIMNEYSGSDNGRVIKWCDPLTKATIFEWDEDFKHRPHYHAIFASWNGKHDGVHYYPGDAVPEPWNTIYFGG